MINPYQQGELHHTSHCIACQELNELHTSPTLSTKCGIAGGVIAARCSGWGSRARTSTARES